MHEAGTVMMRADCIRELDAFELCRMTVKPTFRGRTRRITRLQGAV